MDDGSEARARRVIMCPAGSALIRKENNPQTDECTECPGTSTHAYNLNAAIWTGNESETGLDWFCKPCPLPSSSVVCSGGTKVTAQKGWWLEIEGNKSSSSRRAEGEESTSLNFIAYQCDPNFCNASNVCNLNRTGPACHRCPKNYMLEVGQCQSCTDLDPEDAHIWRIVFCCVAGLAVCFVWFLISWTPVFGTTAKQFFVSWFGGPLRLYRKVKTYVNRSKKLAKTGQKAVKTGQKLYSFFNNPKNLKLFQVFSRRLKRFVFGF